MIDLHTHSLLSDGLLLPSELIRRAEVAGYKVIGITDHVDRSNIDFIISALRKVCRGLAAQSKIKFIPGVELTHIAPADFKPLVAVARKSKIKLVVGHGETIVEPVRKGTNRAAIEAGVDILAHPGLITLSDAKLAAEKGVFLEISARAGHCLANGHVVKVAQKAGAKLVLNTDSHAPGDLITDEKSQEIAAAAGLEKQQIIDVLSKNPKSLISRLNA